MKVSIDKIVMGMEFCDEDTVFYYNPKTNAVFCASCTGDIYGMDDESERVDLIESSISLPTKYEINEYSMMKDFAETVEEENHANKLKASLNGKGAFRRFKDCLYESNIEDAWFKYRDNRYNEIAIEWCERNNLDYIDDFKIKN